MTLFITNDCVRKCIWLFKSIEVEDLPCLLWSWVIWQYSSRQSVISLLRIWFCWGPKYILLGCYKKDSEVKWRSWCHFAICFSKCLVYINVPGVRQFVYITGSMTGLQSSTQSKSTKAWSSSQSGVTTPLPQRRTVSIWPTFHRGPFPLPLPLPPKRRMVTLPIKYTPYHHTINFCWHHGEPHSSNFFIWDLFAI